MIPAPTVFEGKHGTLVRGPDGVVYPASLGSLHELLTELVDSLAAERAAREAAEEKLCGSERLADTVAALVRNHAIDSHSAAADALLDYRDPPRNERTDLLAAKDAEIERLTQERDEAVASFKGIAADVLIGLAGIIPTPVEGYERMSSFVLGDIRRLRKRCEEAEAGYKAVYERGLELAADTTRGTGTRYSLLWQAVGNGYRSIRGKDTP